MKIICFQPTGLFAVNSYAVISEKGNALLIDAPKGVYNQVAENGLRIKKILLTHGHCDHIESLDELVKKTGAEVYINSLDKLKLTDDFLNLSDYFSDYMDCAAPHYSGSVSDAENGGSIILDELTVKILHTPGHTSGSVCYFIGNNIFSGDTLFCRSIGRTDMTDGSYTEMLGSLKALSELEGDYTIYPGHNNATSLSYEIINNPYLKGTSYDDML